MKGFDVVICECGARRRISNSCPTYDCQCGRTLKREGHGGFDVEIRGEVEPRSNHLRVARSVTILGHVDPRCDLNSVWFRLVEPVGGWSRVANIAFASDEMAALQERFREGTKLGQIISSAFGLGQVETQVSFEKPIRTHCPRLAVETNESTDMWISLRRETAFSTSCGRRLNATFDLVAKRKRVSS